MGHICWSCCPNATSLSPLATAKAIGLDIRPRCSHSRMKSSSSPPLRSEHQRESCPAGGEGRGADDDCTADDGALGCWGLGCAMDAACSVGGGDGGVNDIFCLMSC